MKSMAPSIELTEEERQAVWARGYRNPAFFAKFFFPNWFPLAMPWVHRGVLAVLTRKCGFLLEFDDEYGPADLAKILINFVWEETPGDPETKINPIFRVELDAAGNPVDIIMEISKFTLVMLPRGFAKTTLLNVVNIYDIVYKECNFPLYISKTSKHAAKQLRTVAKHLGGNARLKTVFGNLKPEQRNEDGLKWSESDGIIQMTNGVMLGALGSQGQVRGNAEDAQRPDRLNIDDLEDKENTKTDDRRFDTREWFFADLIPSLPKLDETATATMLCNAVHSDSLGFHLMIDPKWTVIKFGAYDRQGDLLWETLWSEDDLETEKASYALQGQLSTYYLEYFNEIRSGEDAKFQLDMFSIVPRAPAPTEIWKAIAIDPAISEKKEADFCSFAVVEAYEGGIIHVRDVYARKGMSPQEQIDKYFELIKKHQMQPKDKYGVESIAYQAALIHLLRADMFRRQTYFEITPITHGAQRKTERVEGILQPRYANGFITHQMLFSELQTQLLDWPKGKKDVPDVVAMAVSLLGVAAPLNIPQNGKKLSEDSYEPLEYQRRM
jgi:hypothetical protein